LKLKLFILTTLVDFAELLTDFSYTNFSAGLSNVECRCIKQTPCSLEHYLVGKKSTQRGQSMDTEHKNSTNTTLSCLAGSMKNFN